MPHLHISNVSLLEHEANVILTNLWKGVVSFLPILEPELAKFGLERNGGSGSSLHVVHASGKFNPTVKNAKKDMMTAATVTGNHFR